MIPVVKPYLPKRECFDRYVDQIYDGYWLTNNGPLVQELTSRLALHWGIDPRCVVLVANGSLALQLAYKALELTGEVITTPFSFIATSSTIKWEGLQPVFSDIHPASWNLDPNLIESKITESTSAIVPVHVFGNPCETEKIREIAEKYRLKVIYDASHCFGVNLDDKSVLGYGDISTVSFHATKLFHTVEGGAVVTSSVALADKIRKMTNFGVGAKNSIESVGINAKLNEFQAAMGLAVLDEFEIVSTERGLLWKSYVEQLKESNVKFQSLNRSANKNFAYFPILLDGQEKVVELIEKLNEKEIQARRYFYPSLDSVEYFGVVEDCLISENIASRILCLPLWPGLRETDVKQICSYVKEVVDK